MKLAVFIFMWLLGLSIVLGFYALIAWGVSVLVSFVFGIDFGFWKAAASLILLSIAGSLVFGRSAKNN